MGKGFELFLQDTMNERKKATKDNIRIVFFKLSPPYLSYCANATGELRPTGEKLGRRESVLSGPSVPLGCYVQRRYGTSRLIADLLPPREIDAGLKG